MSIQVRPLKIPEEVDDFHRLLRDAYVGSGWYIPQPDGRLIRQRAADETSSSTILVAVKDDQLVGTCSLTLDGDSGLQLDRHFEQEIDAIRKEGRSLASSWRIATMPGLREGNQVVRALLWANVEYWRKHSIDTCLMTFAPIHESVYAKLLNCKTVAKVSVPRSQGKPLVLMRYDRENCPSYWERKHGFNIQI